MAALYRRIRGFRLMAFAVLSFFMTSCTTAAEAPAPQPTVIETAVPSVREESHPGLSSELPPPPDVSVPSVSVVSEEAAEPAVFPGSGLLGTVPYSVPEEGPLELSISLWESGINKERISEALDLYEELNPGVEISAEFIDYPGYWGNVSADAGSGKLSDIIEMDLSHISQFAIRGLVRDFSAFAGGVSGYGIPTGLVSRVMLYDEELLSSLGIAFPPIFSMESLKETGSEVFGECGIKTDTSLGIGILEAVAAYRGNDIYEEIREGEDLSARIYFSLVEDVSSLPYFSFSGTDECWNSFSDTTGIAPSYGAVSVSFSGLEPYAMLSVSSSSDHPDAAAALIEWLVASPEAGRIMRLSFGVPAFRHAPSDLSEAERMQLEFISSLPEHSAASVPPIGNPEIGRLLRSYSSLVRDGSLTPDEAASSFVSESRSILEKAEGGLGIR